MIQINSHLDFLLGSSQDISDHDKHIFRDWESFKSSFRGSEDGWPTPTLDNYDSEKWPTVLDIYCNTGTEEPITAEMSGALSLNSCVTRLLQKQNLGMILDSLFEALCSERRDDVVSAEITEILGFDEIDLVMDIIRHRTEVVEELSALQKQSKPRQSKPVHAPPQVLSQDDARLRMARNLQENSTRPLFSTSNTTPKAEALPHVYSSTLMEQGNILSQFGSKYMLPIGTVRTMQEEYEEVTIPPSKNIALKATERLLLVDELGPLARESFPGYRTLNRIQSIIYPTAYGTNENLLVCAPTGAGKTDVAMLAILRAIDQHRSNTPLVDHQNIKAHLRSTIHHSAFKIIYVAPMKALASEIVRKLGKRLKWLSIQVRELTGDMQMTKAEIAQTQIIVTTPEKWDVVTRKPTGEGELASALKLLIIDEVHLLNEERGAVIETIVARTLRQVESSQSMIRIVGLSATLPNYVDVAEFLSVSKYKGLFYFDSSFRPVPLEQHFLGIKGKPGSAQSKKNLDRVTFLKVSELVAQGHQVMVFVHARKETVKAALALQEAAIAEGNSDDFSCEDHPQWSIFRRSIGESRNKEMKQLFDSGFGIHHAGMLRSDRNMMERMFEARAIKVLCCTATLAWGVNLPAHAVIIKGTQVYDSSKGSFVDLSVLDVLQVFGRAGRPGFESSGQGYICTTADKLPYYLDAMTSQIPIESQFQSGLIDALNAEISLGTVANVQDAVRWLGYTYLFVRMRKNPFIYGITRDATGDDPQLGSKRLELVTLATKKLLDAHMITFDSITGILAATDLGRIAARYYVRYASIEIFNGVFRPKMTEADVLAMLSMSTEFDQIQVRESEMLELEQIAERVPCDVKGGADTTRGKVNILMQAGISRESIDDFALVSDMAYAMQNGARIVRALLEIAISKKWANVAAVLMGMSKAFEKRLWPFDQPLKQFDLKAETLHGLQEWADEWSPTQLAALDATELGKLIHLNEHHGRALLNASKQFPAIRIGYNLRPLGSDILKVGVRVNRAFSWNLKIHGSVEPFWLWIEDHEGLVILQLSQLMLRQATDVIDIDFILSVPHGTVPPSFTIRYVSDRWMGAEDEIPVSLSSLIMPTPSSSFSPLLNLPLLSTSIIKNSTVAAIFSERYNYFNAVQTQTYWSFVNTRCHVLLAAPAGGGKSTLKHLIVWMTALQSREARIIIVTPTRTLATEAMSDLRVASRNTGVSVEYAAASNILNMAQGKVIRVVTASNLLESLSNMDPRLFSGIDLVVCDNLELLDSRYELAVSLLRHATQLYPTRFIGLSSSLNDVSDLADWFGVEPSGLHSFRPRDRDQSLTSTIQAFTIPQSAVLFKAMVKPTYMAIRASSPTGNALVFVPSRGQCKSAALDLITQCALEAETEHGFLPSDVSQDYLEHYLARLQDPSLVDFVSNGIGYFHDGMGKIDKSIVLKMYVEEIIRVLIVPRDSCWSLPVRATVVVVMGTQYLHVKADGSDRQLCDYELADLVRMQSRAVRHDGQGRFHLFCQAEAKDTFTRFLDEGLPLESQLLETDDLARWYNAQKERSGGLKKQDILDVLSFTFLARRVVENPTYYDCTSGSQAESLSRFVDTVIARASELTPASLIVRSDS